MGLQSASIVFNDSSSQFNKDLTDFLKRNIEVAIKKGKLSFQFKIAKPADLSQLRNMGVKRLPVMLIGKIPFIGVPDIIEEIRRRVKTSTSDAAQKSEEEIIRDFQINALGNVKKDADGKFQINDDQEKDDNDSPDLMAAFNKEISRRGNGTGNGKGSSKRSIQPPNPDRNQENEFDDDHPVPPMRHNNPMQPKLPKRPDNLDNPSMSDAYESLKKVSKNATGDDMQDDVMMAALLNRMTND